MATTREAVGKPMKKRHLLVVSRLATILTTITILILFHFGAGQVFAQAADLNQIVSSGSASDVQSSLEMLNLKP